jgi:adenylate cyclase
LGGHQNQRAENIQRFGRIDRNGGIVNKFLGDGFLALFGAPFDDPNAAAHAVTAAREMLAAISEATGRCASATACTSGTWWLGVGSPRRKEYTVIGDTVNLASRIEGLNKEFGSRLLISDVVHQEIGNVEGAVSLGDVPVRGYQQSIQVWRLA